MAKFIRILPSAFIVFLSLPFCFGQSDNPVLWRFHVEKANVDETSILMNASIAPGWHLYSQFLTEGGPVPTHFTFEQSDDFTFMGRVEEAGTPIKFYSELFEMEITWYTGQALFTQRIRLHRPVTTITGRVEYMACNDQICIPADQLFNISIKPPDHKK